MAFVVKVFFIPAAATSVAGSALSYFQLIRELSWGFIFAQKSICSGLA
jgi:hypothetical protein